MSFITRCALVCVDRDSAKTPESKSANSISFTVSVFSLNSLSHFNVRNPDIFRSYMLND